MEVFKKLVVVVNREVFSSGLNFLFPSIHFTFIGGNTSIEGHLSKTYMEEVDNSVDSTKLITAQIMVGEYVAVKSLAHRGKVYVRMQIVTTTLA